MRTVRVRVAFPSKAKRGYDVLIRDGILEDLAEGKVSLPDVGSYVVVTDSNVVRLYGEKLATGLARSGRKVGTVSFRAGERSKTLEAAGLVASKLSKIGADRGSLLLALGGGVVGDLAGFVASIYKRGVDYIQLPTTLLAQVDSSIGGKTGVDTPWGKNQLGTFHQPRSVITDPLVLRSLPRKEILNGFAEIVKCAIIADKRMYERLSGLAIADLVEASREFIATACRIKAEVVSKDEKEAGLRAVLNFGHTVGHAIESTQDYRLSHGTCVTLGMIAESWISFQMGIMHPDDFGEVNAFLRRLSESYLEKPPSLDATSIFSFALRDKKTASSSVRMSLPSGLGKMHSGDGDYRVRVSSSLFKQSIGYLTRTLRS